MDSCTRSRPDPNARYHKMLDEPAKYDWIEGLVQVYRCEFCGLIVVAKNKDVMVTRE